MKITKDDFKSYLKFGPMEFDFKKALILYLIFDFPIYSIIYWLIYFFKK